MKSALDERIAPLLREGCEIVCVPSIVNLERFRRPSERDREKIRASLGFTKDHFVISCIAGFFPLKRQRLLIKALSKVLGKEKQIRLNFIGDHDKEHEEYFRHCVSEAEASEARGQIRFNGFTRDIEKWYQASDCVVVSSEREGLARCMIEAIACGVPVVSFDVTSAREVLAIAGGRACGIVVRNEDFEALVQGITFLLWNVEERRRLSENGPAVAAEKFSQDNVLPKILEAIAIG